MLRRTSKASGHLNKRSKWVLRRLERPKKTEGHEEELRRGSEQSENVLRGTGTEKRKSWMAERNRTAVLVELEGSKAHYRGKRAVGTRKVSGGIVTGAEGSQQHQRDKGGV